MKRPYGTSRRPKKNVKELIREHVKPKADRMTAAQWILAGLVVAIFFGFLDTLIVACILGYLGVQLPAYFGVPTTFSGYFFTGLTLGRIAPSQISWELAVGVLICVLLFMVGFVGLRGHRVLWLLIYFGLLPAVGVGACHMGVLVARRKRTKN